jgi:hypothetical protein
MTNRVWVRADKDKTDKGVEHLTIGPYKQDGLPDGSGGVYSIDLIPMDRMTILDPDNLDPKAIEAAATALGAIFHDDLEWEELGPLFQDEERLRAKTAIRAYLEAAASSGS